MDWKQGAVMCIPKKDYEAEVAAAEKEERPCMFKLDEQQEDPPCFDGLSADDQKKVRDRQKKRAEEIAALEEADAE